MKRPWVTPETVQSAAEAIRAVWPQRLRGEMLLASAVVGPDDLEGPVVAWGEVVGIPRLLGALNTFYGSERIHEVLADETWLNSFSELAGEKWKRHNLFLFGGPVHNCLTRRIFGWHDGWDQSSAQVSTKCSFVHQDSGRWALAYPGKPKGVTADFGPLKSRGARRKTRFPFFRRDYGLVVSCRNPWNPERVLMLFAGVRCVGSSVAVASALLPGLVEELADVAREAHGQRGARGGRCPSKLLGRQSRHTSADPDRVAAQVRHRLEPVRQRPIDGDSLLALCAPVQVRRARRATAHDRRREALVSTDLRAALGRRRRDRPMMVRLMSCSGSDAWPILPIQNSRHGRRA